MTKVLEALFDELRPSVAQLVKEAVAEALEKGVPHYPERVSISVASEITGYSVNSLYQMHSKGKVPGALKVGGKLMFETATLRKWVAEGGNATPSYPQPGTFLAVKGRVVVKLVIGPYHQAIPSKMISEVLEDLMAQAFE